MGLSFSPAWRKSVRVGERVRRCERTHSHKTRDRARKQTVMSAGRIVDKVVPRLRFISLRHQHGIYTPNFHFLPCTLEILFSM